MKNFNFKAVNSKVSFKNFNELKPYGLPEVCFTGRSNVGKSSLINAITDRRSLATTSSKPGHTKKIFFYTLDKKFILVDLPGYGFAKVSKKKNKQISDLIFLYLTKRVFLKKVFILVDSRHGFKDSDINFIEFLDANNLLFQIVFTKNDKITKKQEEILIKNFALHKLIKNSQPFFTSSKKKIGIKEIKKQIIESFIQNG